ncbi:hypothetical protein [Methylosinus sp. Sm6]|uniref:hypothetical protein n=1 Tax=Methylosinus sp. Sm6 TaxID=2866948 RepID=UPI001C98EE31|nr:hypothetical protein [Methylosinus sp. Sm6]MBY6243744.1 hypothetical protein [Methylosinus sp. Sm6]
MTLAPVTTAQMLQAGRVFAMRDAIVAAFAAHFPDLAVKAHVGKLDMGDVLEKDVFSPPCILIAATRLIDEDRLSGSDDLLVHLTAYVVTEDKMIGQGDARRLVKRDELALAICEAALVALSDIDWTGWGLENVSDVDGAESHPLFTMKSFERGTVYYAVTWRQRLYALGDADFFTGGEAA